MKRNNRSTGKISLKGVENFFDADENAQFVIGRLNEDRTRSNCFCDFTIKTSTHDYPVHKCMLGVTSDFFKKMFTSNMKEMYEKSATLEGINNEIMTMVIEFIYGDNVRFTTSNAYSLLEAADYLQMPRLQTCCIKFLVLNLSPENILKTWECAKSYDTDNFLHDCEAYIAKSFATFLRQKKHLDLDLETLLHFITMREANTSEQLMFESIVQWVEHDKSARQEHFSQLFKLIDLNKLPKAFINSSVSNNDLVLDCHECSKILLKAMTSHHYVEESESKPRQTSRSSSVNEKDANVVPTSPIKTALTQGMGILAESLSKSLASKLELSQNTATSSSQLTQQETKKHKGKKEQGTTARDQKGPRRQGHAKKLLVMGGENSSQRMRAFDIFSKEWSFLPDCTFANSIFSGLAIVNNVVFVVGGRQSDSMKSCNNLSCFNIFTMRSGRKTEWQSKPSMNTGRYKFGCAVLNNQIFIAGGLGHRSEWLRSVESYNVNRNKWSKKPSLNCNRGECSMVENGGLLYVIGGFENPKNIHSSIEIFDGNSWEMGPCMKSERASLATAVINNEIYAIGGHSNQYPFDASVEKLSGGIWKYVARLKIPRSGHTACVIDDKIYVAGGSNHKGPVNSMEVYDSSLNQWNIIADIYGDPKGASVISL